MSFTPKNYFDFSETLFTYMKNTVGVDDELDKMGFGLADPFQKKQNVEDQQKLHPSFVRLGVKSAHRINNEPTARKQFENHDQSNNMSHLL